MSKFLIIFLVLSLVAGCGGSGLVPDAGQPKVQDKGLRVGTWNLYYGADLGDAVMAVIAGDPEAMFAATTAAFAQVRATDFPQRAQVIADEIVAADLDLVGLQEAALWRTQFPADTFDAEPTPAETVELDFVQILLDALAARGVSYDVAAALETFDAELPRLDETGGLEDVRLTDREVILVRRRAFSEGSGVEIEASDAGLYTVFLELPGGMAIPQGWVSVDARYDDVLLRFISTHLEADIVEIRMAQAAELLAATDAADMPVIVAGDFNSDAMAAGSGAAAAYDMLVNGGLVDAAAGWVVAEQQGTATRGATLDDGEAQLEQRIDLVLLGGPGGLVVEDIWALGHLPEHFVAGLWPSDHAGVCVELTPAQP